MTMLNDILTYNNENDDVSIYMNNEYFLQICEIIKSKICFDIVKTIIYPYYKNSYYSDLNNKCWKVKNSNSNFITIKTKNVYNIFNEFIKKITKKILNIIAVHLSNIYHNINLTNIDRKNKDYWNITYCLIYKTYSVYYLSDNWNNGLQLYSPDFFAHHIL